MGFAKCLEDNIKIMEDRFYMQEQIYQETITEIFVKIEPCKKNKIKNKRIECCECGEGFLFTGGEQHYYEKHKLKEPKRCPKCRKAKKEVFKKLSVQ